MAFYCEPCRETMTQRGYTLGRPGAVGPCECCNEQTTLAEISHYQFSDATRRIADAAIALREGISIVHTGAPPPYSNIVKAARALAGWTQIDLAREIESSPSTIADIERAAHKPSGVTAKAIVDAFERRGIRLREDGVTLLKRDAQPPQ